MRARRSEGDQVVRQADAERRHEQEDHDDAVHREQGVVGLRAHQLATGVGEPARIMPASAPPIRRTRQAVTQYITLIRLWSVVVSHATGPT